MVEMMARVVHLPLYRETERAQRLRVAMSDPSLIEYLRENHFESWEFIDGERDPDDVDLAFLWEWYQEALSTECEIGHEDGYDDDCEDCGLLQDYKAEVWSVLVDASCWLAAQLGVEYDPESDEFDPLFHHECGTWVPLFGSVCAVKGENAQPFRFRPITPPASPGVYYVFVAGRVKIGKSKNIAARISEMETAFPEPPVLLATEIGNPTELERKAHRRWVEFRRHREWFACEGELAAWLAERNKAS